MNKIKKHALTSELHNPKDHFRDIRNVFRGSYNIWRWFGFYSSGAKIYLLDKKQRKIGVFFSRRGSFLRNEQTSFYFNGEHISLCRKNKLSILKFNNINITEFIAPYSIFIFNVGIVKFKINDNSYIMKLPFLGPSFPQANPCYGSIESDENKFSFIIEHPATFSINKDSFGEYCLVDNANKFNQIEYKERVILLFVILWARSLY